MLDTFEHFHNIVYVCIYILCSAFRCRATNCIRLKTQVVCDSLILTGFGDNIVMLDTYRRYTGTLVRFGRVDIAVWTMKLDRSQVEFPNITYGKQNTSHPHYLHYTLHTHFHSALHTKICFIDRVAGSIPKKANPIRNISHVL